jgi:hypothetical protein
LEGAGDGEADGEGDEEALEFANGFLSSTAEYGGGGEIQGGMITFLLRPGRFAEDGEGATTSWIGAIGMTAALLDLFIEDRTDEGALGGGGAGRLGGVKRKVP